MKTKMKDNDIIKALESMIKLADMVGRCVIDMVDVQTLKNALDLINRQKAEIERSKAEIKDWEDLDDEMYERAEASLAANIADGGTSCHWCIENHRIRAIKEFAERLKNSPSVTNCESEWLYLDIDNLVKEMTEGNENA